MDVDLAASLLDFIILDVDDMEMEIKVHYENLHVFCSACKNIGYVLSSCRLIDKHKDRNTHVDKPISKINIKNVFVGKA